MVPNNWVIIQLLKINITKGTLKIRLFIDVNWSHVEFRFIGYPCNSDEKIFRLIGNSDETIFGLIGNSDEKHRMIGIVGKILQIGNPSNRKFRLKIA